MVSVDVKHHVYLLMLIYTVLQRNRIVPGMRPLSSMTPTIVYNMKRPCAKRVVIGASNGTRIITGLLLFFLSHIPLPAPFMLPPPPSPPPAAHPHTHTPHLVLFMPPIPYLLLFMLWLTCSFLCLLIPDLFLFMSLPFTWSFLCPDLPAPFQAPIPKLAFLCLPIPNLVLMSCPFTWSFLCIGLPVLFIPPIPNLVLLYTLAYLSFLCPPSLTSPFYAAHPLPGPLCSHLPVLFMLAPPYMSFLCSTPLHILFMPPDDDEVMLNVLRCQLTY